MPNKDINLTQQLFLIIIHNINAISSFAMAFFVAILRIYYMGTESRKKRIFVESVLCGLIAASSGVVFEYFQAPEKLAMPFGAIIAFLGVDQVRAMAIRYVIKPTFKQTPQPVNTKEKSDE